MLKTCLSKLHSLCYFMIADYIYDIISYILYTIYYTYILIYIHNIHNIHTFIYIYIHMYIFIVPFCGWGATASRLYRNSWYSLDQSWKDERLRWPWSHPVVLNFCISLVITKYKIKVTICQTDSYMNIWPLAVNYFKMTSQSYLAGLS